MAKLKRGRNKMSSEIQKVKNDLISEIDKRIDDKIIEQTNADILKKLIRQAETINEAIMIAELGTTYKRTGFHFDKRLEKMTDTIKYFKKNEKLSFVTDKNALTHKLIIGDNYDALTNLLVEYRGKIDVIYIDPPYGKDSMGEFAKTNYENAITRDNLLSMLYPRLVLARQLLSDNGVIFCSIDDKNQAYVKGLFDEVFEENNFIANFIWRKKYGGGKGSNFLVDMHEYVLCYSKNIFNLDGFGLPRTEKQKEIFSEKDEFYNERGGFYIRPLKSGLAYRPTLIYDIKCPDDSLVKTQWICAKETYEKLKKENRIVFKLLNDGSYNIYKKFYENDRDAVLPESIFYDLAYNQNGKEEIKAIFNIAEGRDIPFDNPKPANLISHLIKFTNTPANSIILDFFAGSGTTGQAVLELNKQDGGKRQFILATANEITDTTPNGIVNDVTSKRLKRVMTGECYDGTKDFKWKEKNKPLGDNLAVYDIATVANFEATKNKTPFDVIDETLYSKEKLGVNEKIKWVCENFEGTQKKLEDK